MPELRNPQELYDIRERHKHIVVSLIKEDDFSEDDFVKITVRFGELIELLDKNIEFMEAKKAISSLRVLLRAFWERLGEKQFSQVTISEFQKKAEDIESLSKSVKSEEEVVEPEANKDLREIAKFNLWPFHIQLIYPQNKYIKTLTKVVVYPLLNASLLAAFLLSFGFLFLVIPYFLLLIDGM